MTTRGASRPAGGAPSSTVSSTRRQKNVEGLERKNRVRNEWSYINADAVIVGSSLSLTGPVAPRRSPFKFAENGPV